MSDYTRSPRQDALRPDLDRGHRVALSHLSAAATTV